MAVVGTVMVACKIESDENEEGQGEKGRDMSKERHDGGIRQWDETLDLCAPNHRFYATPGVHGTGNTTEAAML